MAERAGTTGQVTTAEGGHPTRPWTVTLALLLLGIVVVTLVVGVAHTIETTIRIQHLLPQAVETTGATQSQLAEVRTTYALTGLAVTAVPIVIATVLTALTIWARRANNTARVMLIAVAGFLSACCVSVATIASRSAGESSQTPLLTELDRLTIATQPTWASVLELPARAVAIGLPLVAIALLLMPASNRFYREQRQLTPSRDSQSDTPS